MFMWLTQSAVDGLLAADDIVGGPEPPKLARPARAGEVSSTGGGHFGVGGDMVGFWGQSAGPGVLPPPRHDRSAMDAVAGGRLGDEEVSVQWNEHVSEPPGCHAGGRQGDGDGV